MNTPDLGGKKVVIFGDGQVATLSNQLKSDSIVITRNSIDFGDTDVMLFRLRTLLDDLDILCVINAIAYTNVDLAEKDMDLSYAINATAVGILSRYCRSKNVPLIHFSTDFVFDGLSKAPYIESDQPNPINHYGRTKLDGEKMALDGHSKVLIFRVAWVYCPLFSNNFVAKMIKAMTINERVSVVNDQIGNLCNTMDLSKVLLSVIDILYKSEKMPDVSMNYGLYHIAPRSNFASRYNIAKNILDIYRSSFDNICVTKEIVPVKTESLPTPAKRPLNSMLNSEKFFNEFKSEMNDWNISLSNATQQMIKRMIIDDKPQQFTI